MAEVKKKKVRDVANTERNRIKRVARNHLGRGFSGPVASKKNPAFPSDEAVKFVAGLKIKFRSPKRVHKKESGKS